MQLETPLAPRDEKEVTGLAAIVTKLNMPVLVRQVVVGGGVVAGRPLLNIEVGLDSAVAVRRGWRKWARQRPVWKRYIIISVDTSSVFARLQGVTLCVGHEEQSVERYAALAIKS